MNDFNYTGFQSYMCTIYEFSLIGGVYFVSLFACRFDSELETCVFFVDFF